MLHRIASEFTCFFHASDQVALIVTDRLPEFRMFVEDSLG